MRSKRLTLGILAHVDAGKTTLSESLLYHTGSIRKRGRVDHKDAFLDTYDLEKDRGITIFSKQALLTMGDWQITLLDTPGHTDFSTEMERTLRVLDYAILVISGTDGVQGHTLTVWKLLERYHIPTVVFVNKMDLPGADDDAVIGDLQSKLSEHCVPVDGDKGMQVNEALAMCDERLMEQYLEEGKMTGDAIRDAFADRHFYPIYFGSALKDEGVDFFMRGLQGLLRSRVYPEVFGARVFKVSRDSSGARLTYVKVTGGSLKVKTMLRERDGAWEEKVDQIRLYSGSGYELLQEVEAGTVCALTGLSRVTAGSGIGFETDSEGTMLVPVLNYKVVYPKDITGFNMLKYLRILEEEEPHLSVVWNEHLEEIHVQMMGEIETEILQHMLADRYNVTVAFEKGGLVYRETIAETVIGSGHFEPLKHYAEVHLELTPLPEGSGMVYESDCSEDLMDRNWQRLVLTHLNETKHKGVLTGSELSDMRITLIGGKGHLKHTEGGDFRQATFRALRQGLMKAKTLLLEPVYQFTLTLPIEMLGRGMADVERMSGSYEDPVIGVDEAILRGTAPVAGMMNYGSEVTAYTKGVGRLNLQLKGYAPCHNQDEVVELIGYNPEEDMTNPSGSVFCSKGVGFTVPWEEAELHMHVDVTKRSKDVHQSFPTGRQPSARHISKASDSELEAIFTKTYGDSKRDRLRQSSFSHRREASSHKPSTHPHQPSSNYLLIDGYNIIFSWEELKSIAKDHMDSARHRLMEIMSSYQGQTGDQVILVFDAYRVAGGKGSKSKYHNIHVVFTQEAETADQYIERLVTKIRPEFEVTVATSDIVEQVIILGKGARRLSAEALKEEVDHRNQEMKGHLMSKQAGQKNRPFEEWLK